MRGHTRPPPQPFHTARLQPLRGLAKIEDIKPLYLNDLEDNDRRDASSDHIGRRALFRRTPANPASGCASGSRARVRRTVATLPPRKPPAAAACAEATDLLQILVFRKALTCEQTERVRRHARASGDAVVSYPLISRPRRRVSSHAGERAAAGIIARQTELVDGSRRRRAGREYTHPARRRDRKGPGRQNDGLRGRACHWRELEIKIMGLVS